ncbi:MAG: radical SAM protein [Candidatus Rokubacteria bacterium]|nr:radical SAM protein [Candidatus Rokubacteria bacterium]
MNIHLRTLGCPKNQVDSELLLGLLDRAGYSFAERPEEADCLIVNTCAFIDRAKEESVEAILELSRLKTGGRARYLVVSGCLSQRYGAELQAELPEVDAFLGTGDLDLSSRAPYAYVKIAEGCDMGCRFCIIPFMRGPHRSRPLQDIVAEVEGLARRGIQEVVLVSQDTLAYGRELKGNGDFADLLLALSETSVPWLRFLYVHPAHVNARFFDAFAQARVLPYLDMPIQHAADEILKAMRRQVTAKRMAEIVRDVRQRIPDVTVRTTVLVGYPGETEPHVAELIEFMEEMRFDRLPGGRNAGGGAL